MRQASAVKVSRDKRLGRQITAIAVVGFLLLALGFLIGRALRPSVPPQSTQSPGAIPAPSDVPGLQLGFARSKEGAVLAAAEFAKAMTGPIGGDVAYLQAMSVLSAPEWNKKATELAHNALRFIAKRYGVGGTISFSPVRFRISKYSATSSSIQMWGLLVGDGPKLAAPQLSWVIATLNVRWVGGDWRVTGQKSVAGPSPNVALRSNRLNGFTSYGHAEP